MSKLILPEGEGKSPHSPSDLYQLDRKVEESTEDFQDALQRLLNASAKFVNQSSKPGLVAVAGFEDEDQTRMIQHSMLKQDDFEELLLQLHNTAHASRVQDMPSEIHPDSDTIPADFIDTKKVKGY